MTFDQVEFNENTFNGATEGCALFIALANTMNQVLGKEKTADILKQNSKELGQTFGQMFKEQFGGANPNVKQMAELIKGFSGVSFGCKMEVEEHPSHFLVRYYNCPLAGAYQSLEMSIDEGKVFCTQWGETFFHSLTEQLGWQYELLKFRDDFDDYCEEKYSKK